MTDSEKNDDQSLPAYVAPQLTVLDAAATAGGRFLSPTEGAYSYTS